MKMKHIKRLDESANVSIRSVVDEIAFKINILHLLMDEGYVNDFGSLEEKVKIEDVNAFLDEENRGGLKFQSETDFDHFVESVKLSCKSLINKMS